jgi:hypothetical protein
VRLVEQWREIQARLPQGWQQARLRLTIDDEGERRRAATFLAPLMAGRSGRAFRFVCTRPAAGPGPEAVRRTLRRLDEDGISGELELVSAEEAAAPATVAARRSFVEQWDEAIAALPPDWSDLYAEVKLASSDYVELAALLLAPVNPARYGGPLGLRFRCAKNFGYGASAGMTRRCFERLDAAGIRGTVEILRALSSTEPVDTQGPVWYVEGRAV